MMFRLLFLIALIVPLHVCRAQPGGSPITFTPGLNSPIVVNDSTPRLIIDLPEAGGIDTARRWINGGDTTYTIYVEARVEEFLLGDITAGTYPCGGSSLSVYTTCDTCWKGGGQHIYIVVDDGPPFIVKDLNTPLNIPIQSATAGPHTLRAFMSRSWDESLKDVNSIGPDRETDLYCVRTFYIDTIMGGGVVDTTKPLLTPNSPLDTNNYIYPPDSVLLDFYMMFKGTADGYVVEATIYDSTNTLLLCDTLDGWNPYCIGGLQEPPVGRLRKYLIRTRLLDSGGTPVTNGPGNFNDKTWAFWVRRH